MGHSELARRYRLPRTTVINRLKKGIPLDAPVMSRADRLAMANKKRLAMFEAGTLKKRPYRVDPDAIERPMELRIEPRNPVNPLACMVVR